MIFNWEEIYKIFEISKETHDFKEYIDEIQENNVILSRCPFDEHEALKQIHKLTGKYCAELNAIAALMNNGMYVSYQVEYKSQERVYNDLNYINRLIPLFALERKSITEFLKKQIQRGNQNE